MIDHIGISTYQRPERKTASKFQLSPSVEDVFIRIAEDLRKIANFEDNLRKDAGKTPFKAKRAERVLMTAEQAELIAEELGSDAQGASVLKLAIVLREFDPTYIFHSAISNRLPTEIAGPLIQAVSNRPIQEREGKHASVRTMLKTSDAYLSIIDPSWFKPAVAVAQFVQEVREGNLPNVKLSEVQDALSNYSPFGEKRMKPFDAPFRNLACIYFKSVFDAETNITNEAKVFLPRRTHHQNVGKAVELYFKGSMAGETPTYMKRVSEDLFKASDLTPKLLEQLSSSDFISKRLSYLSNALPFKEYELTILPKMREIAASKKREVTGSI